MHQALIDLRLQHAPGTDLLRLGQQLRKNYPSEQAIWLLQQLEMYWSALRLEAFAEPLHLYFEAQALQMGSRWPLARRRAQLAAQRFPSGLWLEVGAGIGGDTLELARVSQLRVTERDPQRREILRHNLQVSGLLERVQLVEGEDIPWQGAVALYADPARRSAKGRDWRNLDPDPTTLWALNLPTCLKLAPGLDESTLPEAAILEYCSHQGVCKEAVVWTHSGPAQVSAWRYQQGTWATAPRQEPPDVAELCPGMWLHEPEPAALRAQSWLPEGGWRIDESLGLVATHAGVTSEWTQHFEVIDIGDADLKSLKKLQARYDFYPLEIKKRGFDVEPEELRKKLPKGRSGGPGVLWLTRLAGRHRALVCRRP